MFNVQGYEVDGLENIPITGPALLIYYHGALPVDLYYLIANLYLERGRILRNIMDNFAFKIPGIYDLIINNYFLSTEYTGEILKLTYWQIKISLFVSLSPFT